MDRNAANLGYTGAGESEDVLRWALAEFHPDIALAASFENTVLIDMMTSIQPDVRVFSIDTGRLPEETFQCAAEAEQRFKIRIEWYLPDAMSIERLLRENGVYSFRDSREARRSCCGIRKVEPLNRALKGLRAWVTGLRRAEAESRRDTQQISIDDAHGGIVKICPLANWTDQQVRDYMREHRLPYNSLMERGYTCLLYTSPSPRD